MEPMSRLYFIFLVPILLNCSSKDHSNTLLGKKTSYVNTFIGTDAHGHTFPGATLPFGMVQLSPDTHIEGWDWCSGYHYSDSSIMGFSHTHLSGTGRGDLLDILLIPTIGEIKWQAGSRENPDQGYRSRFSHDEEWASPGYYGVLLKDYNIRADLTVTHRAGFHKYTFPASEASNILIDLFHGLKTDSVIATGMQVKDSVTLTGYRLSRGWGEPGEEYFVNQKIFCAIKFSKQPKAIIGYCDGHQTILNERIDGREAKVAALFSTDEEEEIFVKIGISAVDEDGALRNLNSEIKDWDFEKIRSKADSIWEQHLNVIQIHEQDLSSKEIFYTALYHAQLAPFLFSDYDGRYLGSDGKIHITNGFNNYTVFSLWDTFRASHPLFTIINPGIVNDFVKSKLAQFKEYGLLPVWSLAGSETNCMIGYHSIPVITDAYFKGIRDYDIELAYEAMKTSAMQDAFDIKYLKEYNFIPRDLVPTVSVAKTLEYAFDDWCIAQLAKELGRPEDYEYFMHRAKAFHNVFDKESGFMRGKNSDGTWRFDFDPYNAVNESSDFIEGNSWQYTWYVPHDVQSLIEGMGGKDNFTNKLDSLFNTNSDLLEGIPMDVSGLIGQYAHGNEPSHHIAYLYNYAGKPWKTQEKVSQILNTLYDNTPSGLCGNEDCGQMSAWYIFSALGFYPVNPAEGIYVIGSPKFKESHIKISENNVFSIYSINASKDNQFIQSVKLNGKNYEKSYIRHEDIINGGKIEFLMGSQVSDWGTNEENVPPSLTKVKN